ncbi:MAG: hypothetical protein ABIW31_04450 [Novosphingobium sp.]
MEKVSFAARHKWDSRFWFVFLATTWFAIAMGFTAPIKLRFLGHPDYPAPWILIVHVWSYFGWITLLTLQTFLVGSGRTALHRKLGILGVVVAVFVTFSGLFAEVFSQRFYAPSVPENIRFFVVPVYASLVFGGFVLPAFLRRRNPPAHKRLILLATSAVVAGPYARWWGDSILAVTGDNVFGTIAKYYTGMDLILICAMGYDLVTRGKIHKVYRYGVPIILALQVVGSLIWHSDWWPPIGRHLLGLAAVPGK